MRYKVEARSVDRKGNPKRKFSFFGNTKAAALANAKNFFRRSNIEAGYYQGGTFHPIRSSRDYEPARAGERASGKGAARLRKNPGKIGQARSITRGGGLFSFGRGKDYWEYDVAGKTYQVRKGGKSSRCM